MSEDNYMQPAITTRQAFRYRSIIVAVLFVGIGVAYMDRVNVSILAANDAFLMDMGIKGDSVKIGMLMSVFLICYGLANVLVDRLNRSFGARRAMMISIAMWVVSLAVGGMAQSFAVMLFARILLGVGEGFYYPLQSVVVKQWIPPKERGKANAAWSIGQSLAPAIAMPLLSYVIAVWGWRESFYMLIPITCVPLLMLYFLVTDTPRENKRVASDELALIEKSLAGEKDVRSQDGAWQNFRLIATSGNYWLLVVWYLSLNLIYWGLVFWLPSYLKEARGFSWQEVGWLSSLPFVLTIMTKAYSGWAVDKNGRSAPILMGGMFVGAACIFGAAVIENNFLAAFVLACASAATSMGLPAAWTLLQKVTPNRSISIAGGVMVGLSTSISSLSPVLIGFFIFLSGGYTGGLGMLIGMALTAGCASAILVIRKY
jgi:MFS family permease